MGRVCGRLINGGVGIYLTSFHLLPCSPSLCGECEGLPTEHTALRTPLKEAAGDQHGGHGKLHPRHHRSCHGWEFPGGARKQACTCVCVCVHTVNPPGMQESRSVFTVLHGTGSIIAFSFLCVTMSIQAAVSLHIRRTLGRRGIVAMVQAAMAVTSWFLAIVCKGWDVGGAWCGVGQ